MFPTVWPGTICPVNDNFGLSSPIKLILKLQYRQHCTDSQLKITTYVFAVYFHAKGRAVVRADMWVYAK